MRIDWIVAAALAGAAAIVIGGGTALAARVDPEVRTARCEERLAAIAERRGISVAELEARIKERLTARVEAALGAGRITQERAARMKERISLARLCERPHAARARAHTRGTLRAAAEFLGMTGAELRAALRGSSLAALAKEQGASLESLEAAMLARVKARLAKAVEAGRITRARAERVLARLERRVDRLVAATFPAG
ncbi:MAG: hypothetical protein ACRDNY_00220 [Gaiellaceae bacterium]